MLSRTDLIQRVARTLTQFNQKDYGLASYCQEKLFHKLIKKARNTSFGKAHDFKNIKSHQDYCNRVPLRDYEDFTKYMEAIKSGEPDILWPGKPKYFCKSSGTTSGSKYIPITKASIKNHIRGARNALFHYISLHKDTRIFEGKMLFLSGSPKLDTSGIIPVGRLSGIVNHEIPAWFQKNKLPTFEVNCIEPWEQKIDQLVKSIADQDIRVFSGIPPWIQMFCERLLDYTGKKTVIEVFPNLELYIHGGVNYGPYEKKLNELFGKPLALIETYPASEGFIAFQDDPNDPGLQLIINDGIFFEFILKSEINHPNPRRYLLNEVQLHQDYAVILTTNAGLWSYLIGDLLRFVSLDPYKIRVTGRISQFISAFGEHVIGSEIDQAISYAQKTHSFNVVEFTVAPQVSPTDNKNPYHEWLIEFSEIPKNLNEIALTINSRLCELNAYYKDLIDGKLLDTLKIRPVRRNAFLNYMRSIGRLGEQFKVHRLSNDRKVVDVLYKDIVGK